MPDTHKHQTTGKNRRFSDHRKKNTRSDFHKNSFSDTEELIILYGWHSVKEALLNPNRIYKRLLVTENSMKRLQEENLPLPVETQIVRPHDISSLLEPDAVHQGLYLEALPLPSPDLDSLRESSLIVALDQITDPHNVGAIVRTSAAFKIDALLTTYRHSPRTSGVLAKSASGGLEYVPFISVRNLADALISLGKAGFLRIGLDSEGTTELSSVTVRRPLVLVLGAEGKGLRHRTRECCDIITRLDMPGNIKSLNVSNAAAISLYSLMHRLPPASGQ